MLSFHVFVDQNSRHPVRFVSPEVVHPLPALLACSSSTFSLLSFHTLTSIKFCNSFVLTFIQIARGVVGLLTEGFKMFLPCSHAQLASRMGLRDVATCLRSIPFVFTFLCT